MTARNPGDPDLRRGTVTAFNEKKGVGYISSGDDTFVVRSEDIDLPGYAVLESGQIVEFEATAGGEPAQNVKPVEEAGGRS